MKLVRLPSLALVLRLLGTLGLILGAGCGRGSAPADAAPGAEPGPIKLRLQTDWYPQAEHGGFYQALAKGFYREAGLEVEILPGGPGPTPEQKVLGGAADLAMGRSDDVMVYVAEDLPFVLVGVFMQHDPQAILVHDASPVRTFQDLAGRNIMAVPGSNWIRYVQARHGITFNLIPLNYGLAQFMADPAFIQQCFITNEPYYVEKNGGRPRTLLLADSGFDPYRVVYTTQRLARENPAAVRAFVVASVRGWTDFITGDPAPAKELIAARNEQMTSEFMDYSIAALRRHDLITGHPDEGERIGALSVARLQAQIDALVTLKIIPASVPFEKFLRTDLMPPELVRP